LPAHFVNVAPLLVPLNVVHGLPANDRATNSQHPFGNHTNQCGIAWLCGFASRPYNRFAFVEDEEAAGLSTFKRACCR
jgi:hypothetical protein